MFIRAEIDAIEDIRAEPVETGNWTKLLLLKRDDLTGGHKDLERMIAEIDPNRS
jgi:hypothetical protein